MSAHHDTPFGGHQGIERTTELIKERYYWKNMDIDIENYVKTCEKCNKVSNQCRKSTRANANNNTSNQTFSKSSFGI